MVKLVAFIADGKSSGPSLKIVKNFGQRQNTWAFDKKN